MMRPVVLLAAALVAAGCMGDSDDERRPRPSGLVNVTSVEDFKAAFNDDTGLPRLVVLLSPT